MQLVNGLWVPDAEVERMQAARLFDGRPDLDVSKVADAAAHALRFRLALDIGAHVGATAIYLASRFERVVAFEAVPDTHAILLRNVPSNVEARNVAISGETGELFFEYNPRFTHLSHRSNGQHTLGKSQTIGPIPAVAIDSLGLTPDFIKVDVEGGEADVVRGARETILRARPVILIEQGGNDEKYFGAIRDEATALLLELGMRQVPKPWRHDRLLMF